MRIVSLSPATTEILFAIGLGQYLVGATRFCTYPEEAKGIQRVGGWLDVDYDKVVALKPSHVLTSTFLQEKIKKELENRGLEVIHTDPRTLERVLESIIIIGNHFGIEDKAREVVRKMQMEMDAVAEAVARIGTMPRVYCEEWHRPPMVSGNWVPDMLEIAGGKSLVESGLRSREVSLEEIQKFNPEVIIATWCGFGEKADVQSIAKRPGWDKLPAVKANQLYAFDDSFLNRPGPRLVDGIKELVKVIHPEAAG